MQGNFKKWNRISGRLSYVPSQPAAIPISCSMLSLDKRLPLDKWNTSGLQGFFLAIKCSRVDSSRNLYQRIRHSMTPGNTGSVPVHIGTRILVERDEDLNRGTIPMPTFARRPSTTSSLFLVDIPHNFTDGQQRQQISELQFEQFPTPSTLPCHKIRFKNQVTTCSDFPSEAVLWIKEVEIVDSLEESKIFAINCWHEFSKLRDAGREDCFCFE